VRPKPALAERRETKTQTQMCVKNRLYFAGNEGICIAAKTLDQCASSFPHFLRMHIRFLYALCFGSRSTFALENQDLRRLTGTKLACMHLRVRCAGQLYLNCTRFGLFLRLERQERHTKSVSYALSVHLRGSNPTRASTPSWCVVEVQPVRDCRENRHVRVRKRCLRWRPQGPQR
jgi:hypothetical protein